MDTKLKEMLEQLTPQEQEEVYIDAQLEPTVDRRGRKKKLVGKYVAKSVTMPPDLVRDIEKRLNPRRPNFSETAVELLERGLHCTCYREETASE